MLLAGAGRDGDDEWMTGSEWVLLAVRFCFLVLSSLFLIEGALWMLQDS